MEALARGNAQVDYKIAFLEGNVMWCDVIYFSTCLKQGRLEVWRSLSSCSVGEGLPPEKLHQQVLRSCVQVEALEGTLMLMASGYRGRSWGCSNIIA